MTIVAPTIRTRVIAILASLALAIGLSGLVAAPASANNPFIATPNGMVGMQQEIVFRAPSLAGQVATIGFVSNGVSNAGQTAVNAQGFGSLNWTPTSAGSWTISGLGNATSIGSTTINVVPMPTVTDALVPNLVQTGVANRITVVVSSLAGIIPPSGSVTLRNQNQNVIGTAALVPASATTSTASVQWTPVIGESVTASYVPSSTAFTASASASAQPGYTSAVVTVALRFPPTLYVGTPTVLGAQTGTGIPQGSASFFFDGVGIIGSTPTDATGGAATVWTPTVAGVHTISTQFSSSTGNFSGVSSQVVNVQPAKPTDVMTVGPQGAPAWNPGAPISVQSGSSTVLGATAQSGATVVLSETGPCVLNGSTMVALAPGQCVLTATSPGSASVTGASATYTIAVTAPPKRTNRPRR